MSDHTPEPWYAYEDRRDQFGWENFSIGSMPFQSLAHVRPGCDEAREEGDPRANANRIVSCVNACQGINPEAVPLMLEALETLYNADWANLCGRAQEVAEAAINAATGKETPDE